MKREEGALPDGGGAGSVGFGHFKTREEGRQFVVDMLHVMGVKATQTTTLAAFIAWRAGKFEVQLTVFEGEWVIRMERKWRGAGG